MNVYQLKSGKKFSISRFPKPREGEVVYFTEEEWTYIREQRFTHAHKDFLWEAKSRNHQYSIVPEKGLTEPETAIRYCREILQTFEKKKAAG